MQATVIVDGRPYPVGKRALALIAQIIKLNGWLETARQPTLELSIGGSSLSVRKTDFERVTVE